MIALACLSLLSSGMASAPKPTLGEFFGINTHTIQFKPDLYKPVAKQVRNYHPVEWDLGVDPAFKPTFPMTRNGVSWEDVYGKWQKSGWKTLATLMFETLPEGSWKKSEDAEAYGRSFGAWFGPRKWVEAVEIGNEPGKIADSTYSMVFGAMAKGIKSTAPGIKVASCAVRVGPSGDYHKSVETLRPHLGLVDILTMHTYSELEPWPTFKRSYPEDPKATYLQPVKELVAWRNKNLPKAPIWVTEFGYDASSKTPDPKGDWAKWVGNTDQEQADWLVRSVLELWRLDVARAYQFWFNDEDQPSMHASSGLTRNYKPKPSFYGVSHLLGELEDWRFRSDLVRKEGQVYAMTLTCPTEPGFRKWVAWVPTREGKAAKVKLPLGVKAGRFLTCIPLSYNQIRVKPVKQKPNKDGSLWVWVSGTPTIITEM